MTPTLFGRWQTRFFLLVVVGSIVSAIFGAISPGSPTRDFLTYFAVLGYVIFFGFAWDALYQLILSFRWDQDWPTTFQVAAGIIEGALIWGLVGYVKILPGVTLLVPFWIFLLDYGLIWLTTFMISQGPLRTLFPRWRYEGGQWF